MTNADIAAIVEKAGSVVGGVLPEPWKSVVSIAVEITEAVIGGGDPDAVLAETVTQAKYPDLAAWQKEMMDVADKG